MKNHKIIFWVATIIIILWEGVMPLATILFAPEYSFVGTRALGYPDYFARAFIVFKVLGVIAIAYPKALTRLKEWAYAGFSFSLIFAFISHAVVDQNIGFMVMPLVFLGILAVSYIYNNKIQWGKETNKQSASTIGQFSVKL